eukprot:UN27441
MVVFICRYGDLLWNFHSMYNTIMKIVFIAATTTTTYLIKYKEPYCKTYDADNDYFNILWLIIPCAILAMVWNVAFSPFEIIWAFSIYLESVVVIPQIVMVQIFATTQWICRELDS